MCEVSRNLYFKNLTERQEKNFKPKIQKTKNMFNMWLQRDLSLFGRVLLSKAEGISRFVYPTLSIYVQQSLCKEINNTLISFIWKNRCHYLKREILAAPRGDGGLELLDYMDINHTFKTKWIKEYLKKTDSLWYFIPQNIFARVGGLNFLLNCDYDISKLPLKLSKFHQQALSAAKLCFNHNFSPHKTIIWNNEFITRGNKSLFLKHWFDKGIIYLNDLQNDDGEIFSYEEFLRSKTFPVTYKEFQTVIKAIPSGILQLMKGHFEKQEAKRDEFTFFINGLNITSRHCNNKHIRNQFFRKRKIAPWGKFIWSSSFSDINWKATWLLPHKFAISNKIKELQFKIIHKIYPTNSFLAKFVNTDVKCVFCNIEVETCVHLFYECHFSKLLWKKIETYISSLCNISINLTAKDILLFYNNKEKKIQHLTNLICLIAKFHIHKSKFSKGRPFFSVFKNDFQSYIDCIKKIDNKKCIHTVNIIEEFIGEM